MNEFTKEQKEMIDTIKGLLLKLGITDVDDYQALETYEEVVYNI